MQSAPNTALLPEGLGSGIDESKLQPVPFQKAAAFCRLLGAEVLVPNPVVRQNEFPTQETPLYWTALKEPAVTDWKDQVDPLQYHDAPIPVLDVSSYPTAMQMPAWVHDTSMGTRSVTPFGWESVVEVQVVPLSWSA
jgi:hypothetical protein